MWTQRLPWPTCGPPSTSTPYKGGRTHRCRAVEGAAQLPTRSASALDLHVPARPSPRAVAVRSAIFTPGSSSMRSTVIAPTRDETGRIPTGLLKDRRVTSSVETLASLWPERPRPVAPRHAVPRVFGSVVPRESVEISIENGLPTVIALFAGSDCVRRSIRTASKAQMEKAGIHLGAHRRGALCEITVQNGRIHKATSILPPARTARSA